MCHMGKGFMSVWFSFALWKDCQNCVEYGKIRKHKRLINQVLSYISDHRSDANNLKIFWTLVGSRVLGKWQSEMLLYNRMSVWVSPAVGEQKLTRRNLSWKESYHGWQQQQKSWHRAVTVRGSWLPSCWIEAEKESSWTFMYCLSIWVFTGH